MKYSKESRAELKEYAEAIARDDRRDAMKHPGGRPREADRDAIAQRFGLNVRQRRHLTREVIGWLDGCADDEARKVLLGIREAM